VIYALAWLGVLTLVLASHLWHEAAESRRLDQLEEEIGALKKLRWR
jgi:hypothetical protein